MIQSNRSHNGTQAMTRAEARDTTTKPSKARVYHNGAEGTTNFYHFTLIFMGSKISDITGGYVDARGITAKEPSIRDIRKMEVVDIRTGKRVVPESAIEKHEKEMRKWKEEIKSMEKRKNRESKIFYTGLIILLSIVIFVSIDFANYYSKF